MKVFEETSLRCVPVVDADTSPVTFRAGPWRCFHCDEVCEAVDAAEHHFGRYDGCTPVCQVAAETYRALEREVQSYRSECDADTVLFYSLGAKHSVAMREAEQTGYDRGTADAKAYPETLGLMPVASDRVEA